MRILRWASRVWIGILILSTLLSTLVVGGRLAVPLFSPPPTLHLSEPLDGARDVSVRARFLMQFDRPMNPRTVEQALRLSPSMAYTTAWDSVGMTLTISPTALLLPATDYRLHIEQSGLSRNLSPLAKPIRVAFRTAAAPAVLATIPAEGVTDAPSSGAFLVSFSRAMIPREVVLQPMPLPELRFEPPIVGQAIWIDQQTLLFRPDDVLIPGQRYRATLDANLTDLGGGPLGQPVSWSFQTALPTVLTYMPVAGTRNISPRQPLTAQLSLPLSPEQIQAGLTISPTIRHLLTTAMLPDGTQALTITPQIGWDPSTEYRATLHIGGQVLLGWNFTTAPRPALIGRFPGVGQILPLGQDIRLIFSTPVDPEALQGALRFDPPAMDVRVTGSGEEVRIGAKLRAATAYTLTIPAEFVDQNGVQLGASYPIRFTTAAAEPSIGLPEVLKRQATFAPDKPIDLLVRRTNISALLVDIYELDEATIVRTLVFDETDWRLFEPERYQRPLLRSWTVLLNDTLNAIAEDRLALKMADGQALPPGMYYVRIRTPEGPRADLLLMVSRTRLAFQFGSSGGLVWATEAISGTILPNQAVALYQDDALILEGVTNQQGLLAFNIAGGGLHRYAALVRGQQPGLVTSGPRTFAAAGFRDRYQLYVMSNATTYQSGDSLQLAGFVRQIVTGTLSVPVNPPPLTLQLLSNDGRIITKLITSVGQNGVFTATIPLMPRLPAGAYRVQADIGGNAESLLVRVVPQTTAALDVRVAMPPALGRDGMATIMVETQAGLPVSGIPISWTLSAEPVAVAVPDGYVVGVAGFAPPAIRVGTGHTNMDGRLTVAISDTALLTSRPLRYDLVAQAASSDGQQSIGAASIVVHPADVYVGIRLRQQVIVGSLAEIELLAVDQLGLPQSGKQIQVELFRANIVADRPLVARRVSSNENGMAVTSLPFVNGGQFLVRASTVDSQGRRVISETMLWATGTPTIPADDLLLIPDRAAYTPGDTAVLLVQLPDPRPAGLLTIVRGTDLVPEVRSMRSGQTITVTLSASDAPAVQVNLLLPGVGQQAPSTISTLLPVAALAAPPVVAISTDRSTYLPGSTANITVTVTNTTGQQLPANLLVAVLGKPTLPGASRDSVYWSGPLRTETGSARFVVPLPRNSGQLRIVALAAGADQIVSAERDLSIAEDVRVRLDVPPFLRVGDQFEIGAWLVNTTMQTQTVALNLVVDGVAPIDSAFPQQSVVLAGLERKRVAWLGTAEQRSMIRMQVNVQSAGDIWSVNIERPIMFDTPVARKIGGALVTATSQSVMTIDGSDGLTIDLASAPDAIALRVARTIAAQPARSLLDEAALLLLTAPMTETHDLAQAAIGRLVATQSSDGGWPWWPELRSQPIVTAAVLEAFAAAHKAGLNVPNRSLSLGATWSATAIQDRALELDVRIQLAYALSLHGQQSASSLQILAAEPNLLSAEGAATLLLALPVPIAENRTDVIARLKALAVGDASGVRWPASAETLGGSTTTTSLVLQALQQVGIEPELKGVALATLAVTRGPDGWASSYATARAIIALRAIWVQPAIPPRVAIELNGERLVEQTSGLMTATLRLDLPSTRLRSTNLLTTTISAGSALLSFGSSRVVTTSVSVANTLLLRDEQKDDLVRIIVIVRQPIPFALLDVPLPPGADVHVRAISQPLMLVAQTPERLLFAADRLVPGLYELRYQVQKNQRNVFRVPPAGVRQISGELAAGLQ